jgi:hypothetical protein
LHSDYRHTWVRREAVCEFLALHQVSKPQNGLVPMALQGFQRLNTQVSAKNLKTDFIMPEPTPKNVYSLCTVPKFHAKIQKMT